MAGRRNRKSYVPTSRASRAVLGSHIVQDSGSSGSKRMHLRSRRGANRANRGIIDNVKPRASGGRSSRRRRGGSNNLVLQEANKKNVRDMLLLAAVVVAALCIVFFVARSVYAANINGAISLKDSDLDGVLVEPEDDSSAYYTLVAGEYSDSQQEYDGPNLLCLVRVDPTEKVVTFLSIPSNTEVGLSDGEYHSICEAQTLDGDAYLVSVVADLIGVDIAHYVKTDAEGFVDIVDKLGGVTVDVPEEADDPDAGDIYISAGEQTLDGEQALVLCRADNYSDSVGVRAQNQMAVLNVLLQKVTTRTGLKALTTLDSIKRDFQTDMKVAELKTLFKTFKSLDDATVYAECIPGSLSVETDGTYFAVSSDSLETMMASVEESGLPATSEYMAVDASSFSVEVRNGGGVDGAAALAQEQLEGEGFTVTSTSNADSYVYTETLVIYSDESSVSAAEAVVECLTVGRTVYDTVNYDFDTDLLVIVGSDWKPLT